MISIVMSRKELGKFRWNNASYPCRERLSIRDNPRVPYLTPSRKNPGHETFLIRKSRRNRFRSPIPFFLHWCSWRSYDAVVAQKCGATRGPTASFWSYVFSSYRFAYFPSIHKSTHFAAGNISRRTVQKYASRAVTIHPISAGDALREFTSVTFYLLNRYSDSPGGDTA